MPTASIAARYFGACSYQRSSSTKRTGAGALLVRTTVALRDGERTERRVRVRTSRASQVAVAGTVTLTVSVADVQDGTIRYGALRRVGQSAPSTVGTTTSGIPPRPVLRTRSSWVTTVPGGPMAVWIWGRNSRPTSGVGAVSQSSARRITSRRVSRSVMASKPKER
jgi:hypothetical protein